MIVTNNFFFGMLTTGAFDENVAPKKNTREYKFKLTETFCIIKVSQNIIIILAILRYEVYVYYDLS